MTAKTIKMRAVSGFSFSSAFILAIAFAACGCSKQCPQGATAPSAGVAPAAAVVGKGGSTNAEVGRVLDDFHDAAAKADEPRYFAHFAEGGVFLGTDGKERWTVPDFRVYAHPHFAKGKAWSFRPTRREITFVNDTAWFDEDLDTPNLGPARGSGVLVKNNRGVWKIAQYNLSVPIPNDRFKEVKTLIEK